MSESDPKAPDVQSEGPGLADTAKSTSVDPMSPNPARRILRVLGWPFRLLLTWLIAAYQRFVSPVLPSSCRYYPSCSAYARKAINRHGAGKGTLLASWRILRCNPWSGGGVDPVPKIGRWLPQIKPDGTKRGELNSPDGTN